MRDKFLTTLLLVLAVSANGESQRRRLHQLPYGDAGCGWGSLVMDKDNQILAATTNGTFGNQTFAISSGTSNCISYEDAETVGEFIEFNRPRLQTELSRGDGELLATLEHLMGCPGGSLAGLAVDSESELSNGEFREHLLSRIHSRLGSRCRFY